VYTVKANRGPNFCR